MNKTALTLLGLLLGLSVLLAACAPAADNPTEPTTGAQPTDVDTLTLLEDIVTAANESLPEADQLGAVVQAELTLTDEFIENPTVYHAGLSAEAWETYVTDGAVSTAFFNTSPYKAVLLKCKDADAAAAVKAAIAEGFDAGQWVCVMPDQAYVIDSGVFVFMGCYKNAGAEALKQAFIEVMGGTVGECDTFYVNSYAAE